MYAFSNIDAPPSDPNDEVKRLTAAVEKARSDYKVAEAQPKSLPERQEAWANLETAKQTLQSALSALK